MSQIERNKSRCASLWISALFLCLPLLAQEEHHHTEPLEQIGAVSFPTTCNDSVQTEFERGVALLHSFWYEEAQKTFQKVHKQDPHCAIAYWGQAMAIYRPLWNRPSLSGLQNGRESIQTARSLGSRSQRERDYIDALAVFYRDDHRDYEE